MRSDKCDRIATRLDSALGRSTLPSSRGKHICPPQYETGRLRDRTCVRIIVARYVIPAAVEDHDEQVSRSGLRFGGHEETITGRRFQVSFLGLVDCAADRPSGKRYRSRGGLTTRRWACNACSAPLSK
jgi:hypothetical protein